MLHELKRTVLYFVKISRVRALLFFTFFSQFVDVWCEGWKECFIIYNNMPKQLPVQIIILLVCVKKKKKESSERLYQVGRDEIGQVAKSIYRTFLSSYLKFQFFEHLCWTRLSNHVQTDVCVCVCVKSLYFKICLTIRTILEILWWIQI